jgi:hypothetical protein
MANLQSSLNSDLGTASLCTIYVTLVVSCALLPPMVIARFGLKWSIVLSQGCYLLYIAANVYPRYYTLLPAAVLVGMGAGPLWTAKCTYLTEIAGFYSLLSQETAQVVVSRFFGIFFTMFQMSQIIGNLVSSIILQPSNPTNHVTSKHCGSLDCPGGIENSNKSHSISVSIKPEASQVYLLCFIYLLVALSSIGLVIVCLSQYVAIRPLSNHHHHNRSSIINLLTSTLKQARTLHQLLLIPITLWLGFSLAFIGADYTKSFIACSKRVYCSEA